MGSGRVLKRAIATAEVFTNIYLRNGWDGTDSCSGTGSDLLQTRVISRAIPALCAELDVHAILDIPCGDFYWMSRVDLRGIHYTGADIVDDLVRQNQARFGRTGVQFRRLDIIRDSLPEVDLILCRDCLVHLSYADVMAALRNIYRSRSTYLLTTTFPRRTDNADIMMGDWRPLNLERAPFLMPPPLLTINERCTEGDGYFDDKSLGLWRVADIHRALTPDVPVPNR